MSAAVITIVVLLVNIAVFVQVARQTRKREREAHDRAMAAIRRIRRSHQLAAEQSRAHARADERQWADDEPARIWRNK